METQKLVSLAVKKLQILAAVSHPQWISEPPAQELSISVISTSFEATAAALKKAGALAHSLGAQICLMVPQIVPFPLPLTSPPVLIEFNEKRYRAIAAENSIEINVQIYLCRDRLETVLSALKPQSLVVIGGPRHWWPTAERRLAWKLRHAGHEVILIETE